MTMPFAVLVKWSKKSMSAFCLRQIGTQPSGSLVRFLTLDCCRDAIGVVARGTFLTAGFTSTRATRKHSSFLLMEEVSTWTNYQRHDKARWVWPFPGRLSARICDYTATYLTYVEPNAVRIKPFRTRTSHYQVHMLATCSHHPDHP